MKSNPQHICEDCQARGRFIPHRRAVVYQHRKTCKYLQTTVKTQHETEKATGARAGRVL